MIAGRLMHHNLMLATGSTNLHPPLPPAKHLLVVSRHDLDAAKKGKRHILQLGKVNFQKNILQENMSRGFTGNGG